MPGTDIQVVIRGLDFGVPACALIDLQMPDMTGLELQQYLANSGLGISTQLTMNLVAESGASLLEPLSYLLKPLRKAALINAINDAIDDTRGGGKPRGDLRGYCKSHGQKIERSKYFASSLPTNTLIAVSRLAHPDMLVEIEAEAIVDPGRLRNLKSYS